MAPNDEFIREVDDEYRRDRIAQIWKRYNGLIIGASSCSCSRSSAAGATGSTCRKPRSQAAGARFEEAVRLVPRRQGRRRPKQALEALAKEAMRGYGAARPLPARRRTRPGATPTTARRPTTPSRDREGQPALAGSRAPARRLLRIDTAEPSAVRPPLERLAVPTNPWRHSARELLGLSGLKTGEMDFAGKWFDQIAADRDTPPSLKQRLAVYTALGRRRSGASTTHSEDMT